MGGVVKWQLKGISTIIVSIYIFSGENKARPITYELERFVLFPRLPFLCLPKGDSMKQEMQALDKSDYQTKHIAPTGKTRRSPMSDKEVAQKIMEFIDRSEQPVSPSDMYKQLSDSDARITKTQSRRAVVDLADQRKIEFTADRKFVKLELELEPA